MFSILSLFCLHNGFAQEVKPKTKPIITKSSKDSLLLSKKLDTIKKDTIIKPTSSVEAKITHNAVDYILQNAKKKQVILYNQAHVTYQDIDLKSWLYFN